MKYLSLQILKPRLFIATAVLCASLSASAACPTPASGKLVICQPSAGSTVFQIPHFEAAANPSSGSITGMKVFIDNKLVFQSGGADLSLFEGGVSNGTHQLLITATDSFGRTYQ